MILQSQSLIYSNSE